MEKIDSNIKKPVQIVLATGFGGAIILMLINFTSFQRAQTHASLLILTFILIIVAALVLNKFLNHHLLSYIQRVLLGFITYSISLTLLFITEILFTTFYSKMTFLDYVDGILVLLLFGLAISFIFAIFLKTKAR
jgi:hypothetical protein